MVKTQRKQMIKSVLKEVAVLIESINGKRILENEGDMILPYVDDNTSREELDIMKKHIQEENRLMTLNPLGHRPIKDIDEVHQRNRRKTDDPYIQATMIDRSRWKKRKLLEKRLREWENEDYKRWKNNTAERR